MHEHPAAHQRAFIGGARWKCAGQVLQRDPTVEAIHHGHDPAERTAVAQQLSRAIGKEVVPHFHVNPSILGGVVVRVGDTVLDGSVRRRLSTLRTRMLSGQ